MRRSSARYLVFVFTMCAVFSLSAAKASSPPSLLLSPTEVTSLANALSGAASNTRQEVVDSMKAAPKVNAATFYWTDQNLQMIVKYQQNPLRAARVLSYVHIGMYEAMSIAHSKQQSRAIQRQAVHLAAAGLLEHFYPYETSGKFMALALTAARDLKLTPSDQERAMQVANAVVMAARRRATSDGSDLIWKISNRPAARPGLWQATPPMNVYRPVEAMAKYWRPWALTSANEITAPPPTVYGTDAYWAEAKKVYETWKTLTPEQKRVADEWNLGLATVTPPGVWNLKAQKLALGSELTELETHKVFAVLNAAMFDAFLACWNAKYTYWTERPVTEIRARYDASFLPYLITPAFPSYVSGHSSVSGAAAEVLSHFFPKQANDLHAMAAEAAESRLYGGIHFESDNNEGLILGRAVGKKAIERLLQRPPAPSLSGKAK